jgi:phage anti-repressor protein
MVKITKKKFLKLYTAIPNRFIDNYYKFYDMCQNELFGIPMEDVLDFLEITERKEFYDRFRKRYKINEDYEIDKLSIRKTQNIKQTIYYITFDTFERICMMSKSKKANLVRDYFIVLRKFIDYYKDSFNNMIIDDIISGKGKYIYIILVNKYKNIFKLGQTEDIRKRLKGYITGKDSHPDIKFIMRINNAKIIESCAKANFKFFEFKKNQEIYKVDINTIKGIIKNCVELQKEKDYIDKQNNKSAYIIFDD